MFRRVTKRYFASALNIFGGEKNSKFQNFTNLNMLNKYVQNNFNSFNNQDHIQVLNKFQELESADPNSKIKLYDFLDYIFYDENKISDVVTIKTIMRVMLAVQLQDKLYWSFLTKIIVKNNMIYQGEGDYLDLLKIYSIVQYEDQNIWESFQDYFLENYRNMNLETVHLIAICFGNTQHGSDQFWQNLFKNFDLKNLSYPDFILNFSISLCGFLQSKVPPSQLQGELFSDYINFSINILYNRINEFTHLEKIDIVYSLFPHFHKSYYVDQIYSKYPKINESNLKKLVENLENTLKAYLDKNLSKLEDEDFEQISKILKYFTHSKLQKIKIKPQTFVQIFVDNVQIIKNYKDIYNFLNYFHFVLAGNQNLLNLYSTDYIWERMIDSMHTMTLDELFTLVKISQAYNISYQRYWIFLQTFIKKQLQILIEDDWISIALKESERFLEIFRKDNFYIKKDYILIHFIYFLENIRDKLIINKSNLLIKH
jgi:hypothetical protein